MTLLVFPSCIINLDNVISISVRDGVDPDSYNLYIYTMGHVSAIEVPSVPRKEFDNQIRLAAYTLMYIPDSSKPQIIR